MPFFVYPFHPWVETWVASIFLTIVNNYLTIVNMNTGVQMFIQGSVFRSFGHIFACAFNSGSVRFDSLLLS